MCHNPEYGPLLLAWMFVKIRYTNASENDQQLLRCRQMGKRALDLNCFSYMHDMISNSIFKEDSLVSRIVRKTVYNMLCCMCDYFDGDGSCCKYPYVYHLLNLVNYWHGTVWLKILVVQRLVSVKGLHANMEGTNLRGCNFEDPSGLRTNLEGVNLKGACLERSNMTGVNLRVANLKDANMKNRNLRAAVLAGADLERCWVVICKRQTCLEQISKMPN
ncbi:hypothetical protein GQX74_011319 [Glossina fuscipes]|nr:hypothetical protein GQX74_011319 [Glossina fuscipes]